MKKLFDTHSHLNVEPLVESSAYLINLYEQNNIFTNVVGTTIKDSKIALELEKKSKNIFCSIGIHPCETYKITTSDWNEFKDLVANNINNISCLGEIGLDYHYSDTNKQIQHKFFKLQIELAIEYNLPIMLHIRDAHSDVIKILESYKNRPLTIIHCYTGSTISELNSYIKMKCFISIPGIVTFKKADDLRELIKLIPHELILSETDAPWLTPHPFRSKTNDSQYLQYTNQTLADIFNKNILEMNKILWDNAAKIFKV